MPLFVSQGRFLWKSRFCCLLTACAISERALKAFEWTDCGGSGSWLPSSACNFRCFAECFQQRRLSLLHPFTICSSVTIDLLFSAIRFGSWFHVPSFNHAWGYYWCSQMAVQEPAMNACGARDLMGSDVVLMVWHFSTQGHHRICGPLRKTLHRICLWPQL